MSELRIVCAANRFSGETIILGARHYDALMHASIEALGIRLDHETCEQGFIDNHRNFHDRQSAWKIAEAANQIIYRCGGDTANGGTLYSENLY